jgi:hypothetical protein
MSGVMPERFGKARNETPLFLIEGGKLFREAHGRPLAVDDEPD